MLWTLIALLIGFALVGCDRGAQTDSDTHLATPISDSAFRQAVREGDVALVTTYLDGGYDISRPGMGGENALHEGVLHFDVAKLLIDRGISVNQKHKFDGSTPLIVATISGNVDVVTLRLLLDEGADPAIIDAHSNTALDYALQYGEVHPEVYASKVELLRSAGKRDNK